MNDKKYMSRALELARLGVGSVSPNPAVGAVIVHNDRIIGEGYHKKHGEAHAEVNAINSVLDSDLFPHSTIYVTLEPCSHWGKTPPCADLIIEKRIKRVVIGVVDPFSKVCGNGIKKLQEAGVEVVTGVLEDECTKINAPFFTAQNRKRPYIILKWAQSSDGFIDAIRSAEVAPRWFTGNDCKVLVHKLRSETDCIMVGRKTVEADDPELTVRSYFGRNPIRATVDGDLKLSTDKKIFNSKAKTILFTKVKNLANGVSKFKSHTNVEIAPLDFSQNIPRQICKHLQNSNIQSLIIEGGTFLINSFSDSNLWDEALIFTSNSSLQEIYESPSPINGVIAPKISGNTTFIHNYQRCKLVKITLLQVPILKLFVANFK